MEQTVCFNDVRRHTIALCATAGNTAAFELLHEFGVRRIADLAPWQWEAYVKACPRRAAVDHRGFPLWDVVKPAQPEPAVLSEALRNKLVWIACDWAADAAKPEPKRPALTWNAKTAFDAFPGFSVFSDTQDAPIYTGSLPTSDPTASHQVGPKFGSSDLA